MLLSRRRLRCHAARAAQPQVRIRITGIRIPRLPAIITCEAPGILERLTRCIDPPSLLLATNAAHVLDAVLESVIGAVLAF